MSRYHLERQHPRRPYLWERVADADDLGELLERSGEVEGVLRVRDTVGRIMRPVSWLKGGADRRDQFTKSGNAARDRRSSCS